MAHEDGTFAPWGFESSKGDGDEKFHISVQGTMSCARGVLWESTPRLLFRAVTVEKKGYLILYIQMYVAQCLWHH
jgi:hypothetical protein